MGKKRKHRTKSFEKSLQPRPMTPRLPKVDDLRLIARGMHALADEIMALCDASLAAGELSQGNWEDKG